jgi:transposase InsO family protein
VESSAVDRQAAHRGCGQQAAHTKPTFPPPDGFDEEDDGYVAPLFLANDVWTRHKGRDFRWPQVGTFTWPPATGIDRVHGLSPWDPAAERLRTSPPRRRVASHPAYLKPELIAWRPNIIWSWDITKLLGPQKWTYYYLYVILDIFSRYMLGWMLAA